MKKDLYVFPNLLYAGFHFYVLNVPRLEVRHWRALSGGMLKVFRQRKISNEHRCLSVELSTRDRAHCLLTFLQEVNIPYPHGVAVVLHSDNSMNGLTIPKYVMDFYRQAGGDFSVSIRVV